MKLRIRFGKRSERVEVTEGDLAMLMKEQIADKFGISSANFELSLNGKDAIILEDTTLVSDLELVSGDLLKIIQTSEPKENFDTSIDADTSLSDPLHTNSSQDVNLVPSSAEGASNSYKQPCSGMPSTSLLSSSDQKRGSGSDGSLETTLLDTENAGMCPQAENVVDVSHGEDSLRLDAPVIIRDCSDGKIPHRLKQSWDVNNPEGIIEAISLVLHVMMLEAGFLIRDLTKVYSPSSEDDVAHQLAAAPPPKGSLPGGWNKLGCCRFSYLHQLYDQSQVCHLACVPLGSLLSVTGLISHEENSSFSLQLKPSEYIMKSKDGFPLRNTAKLSRLFKDSVAHPMTHQLRKNCGLLRHDGILALPVEIQMQILRYLDVKSLLRVSQVCQSLLGLSQADGLWRCLCLRDWRITSCVVTSNNCSWKEVYKKHYQELKERERAEKDRRLEVLQQMRHPHFVPGGFPGVFPGAYFPGIRGGDYDLDPFGNPFQPQGNPLYPNRLRPRRDPIFPEADLDPMRGGTGRGLRDNAIGLGFRGGRSGGMSGSFGGMGF